jgi:hypothetical protein
MNGFVVTFPSSLGDPCFLVTPGRVGHVTSAHYPWSRATFVATVFPTQDGAQAALDRMKGIHHYIAPEVNGGLSRRLALAQVLPAGQVTGIEFDPA